MKTVTMLEFRQNSGSVLKRVASGERIVLSRRGRPAARLEPVEVRHEDVPKDDPFLTIAARARPAPNGPTSDAGTNGNEDKRAIKIGRN